MYCVHTHIVGLGWGAGAHVYSHRKGTMKLHDAVLLDDPVCAGIPPMMAKDRAAWRAKKEAEVDLREHLRDHRNSFAGLEGDTTPLCPAAFWPGCRPCCPG